MALKSTSKKASKSGAVAKSVTATKGAVKKKTAAATAPAPAKARPVQKSAPKAVAPAPREEPTVKAKHVEVAPETATHNITLTYFAPEARSVLVAGDFTRWETSPVRLVKEETGVWKATLALKPGKYQYRLLVDGQWQNDPQCPELKPNHFGSLNCVLSVAA